MPDGQYADTRLRVLLVAPRTDLLMVDEEVQDIIGSGLNVRPLLGSVSQTELVREIQRREYDVLWFATHMAADGIVLSDGNLSASALAPIVRSRFSLVFLNTCQSLSLAQMLLNETNADVICTVVDIPDADAWRTGSLFAHELAQTGDTREAYERSKPGANRLYLYLAAADSKKKRRTAAL